MKFNTILSVNKFEDNLIVFHVEDGMWRMHHPDTEGKTGTLAAITGEIQHLILAPVLKVDRSINKVLIDKENLISRFSTNYIIHTCKGRVGFHWISYSNGAYSEVLLTKE